MKRIFKAKTKFSNYKWVYIKLTLNNKKVKT